ncbi:hypothetical protein CsSME_00010249 [Camellia sinensis var. sinensis]|uniref:DUF679 domain-containing protein n=1 Tax=Camellia sinensis var. sinensis TaxID=542762 RepID=A0A4V3WL47_CAMSN|nr:protein DMP3-like [Camellia sinensis]THG03317.1 hypothetical protein TEA_011328 [Camellia sinensis var. sinensis]
MSLRARPIPSKETSISNTPPITTTTSSDSDDDNTPETLKSQPPPPTSPSFSQGAISQTLTSTANLANLLPTGTILAFQLLTPIFTTNGSCDSATRPMTLILLLLLATSCFLSSFTDSFKSPEGQVYYGFATFKGMWLFDYQSNTGLPDLSKYRVTPIDVVHAVLSMLVFVAVALRDKNVLSCFYPKPAHETQEVLDIVPIGIGLICSLLFMVFPTRRHGIGYPVTPGK